MKVKKKIIFFWGGGGGGVGGGGSGEGSGWMSSSSSCHCMFRLYIGARGIHSIGRPLVIPLRFCSVI